MPLEQKIKEPNRRGFFERLGKLAQGAAGLTVSGCLCIDNQYDDSRMAEELHKVRPLTERITELANSTTGAVQAVVQWCEKNFFHYYGEPDLTENWGPALYGDSGYVTTAFLQSLSIEDVFRERAVGCHEMAFVMITMLRSIGIDAEYALEAYGRVEEGCIFSDFNDAHGVLYVPDIERYVHGDLVADLAGTPAAQLIQTGSELQQMSAAEGGYMSFQNTFFDKYWFTLRRSPQNKLYVYGLFKKASEEERNVILGNLAEYHLTLQPERDGFRWVNSARIPIEGLRW